MANDLQKGLWNSDSRDFAEMAANQIRASTQLLRSAILRGLDSVDDYSFSHERAERFLPEESRLTRTADEILPKLCDVARMMDEPTRKSVAAADYGSDIDKHLKALNDVLSSETCLFPKNEFWYPSEVVELVSHVRSTRGFVTCTALLLANALKGRDNIGWFEFRWERLAVDYNALPDGVRGPILAGIRYLYEADENFLWYSERKDWDPALTPERMILPVDL
ncbi:hypothetical protein SLH47_17440 [Cognatiyoonia sp. IB215182]|nr:hypothetical protein [Cognatiyoonia sp. IB215182]